MKNLLFILLVSLIVMIVIAYYQAKKDILSPWVILIFTFIISTTVAILNINRWNQDIHLETIIIIVSSLTFFGLGEIITNKTHIYKYNGNKNREIDSYELIGNGKRININILSIIIICSLMSVVTYEYFQFIYKISLMQGNPGSYTKMLDYARAAFNNLDIDTTPSSWLKHGMLISKCFAYFFSFIFIYNNVFFKFHNRNILYLFPIAIFVIQSVLSTGRTEIMHFVMYVLIVIFILWKKKNNWNNNNNFKIIKSSLFGIIIFLIIFQFLGSIAGKFHVGSLWDTFSIYTGSSIIAFDKYLQNPPVRSFWGSETLYEINALLRALGFPIPSYVKQLEFVNWGEYSTNIYTALRRYIQDYTIAGCILIVFVLGIVYNIGLKYVKNKRKIGKYIIFYAMFFTPIMEFSIEERFFTSIVSLSTLYTILYINIIWWYFITRKTRKIVRRRSIINR